MINPRADRPVVRQLADLIRNQIADGTLPPGTLLPAAHRLAQEHGVGRDTVRRAMAILRGEGLVVSEPPVGIRVRPAVERTEVRIQRGSVWIARMPTPAERDALDLDEGVPVIEVTHGVRRVIHAGDRHVFRSL